MQPPFYNKPCKTQLQLDPRSTAGRSVHLSHRYTYAQATPHVSTPCSSDSETSSSQESSLLLQHGSVSGERLDFVLPQKTPPRSATLSSFYLPVTLHASWGGLAP